MSSSANAGETDLTGHVAVVTGGGRGIGAAIAQALAGAGAHVAVLSRSKNELDEAVSRITKAGGKAHAFTADVAAPESVRAAFKSVARELGPVDVLVNNAGAGGTIGPLWENSPDEWWRTMEVNLRGPMLCAQAVLPKMLERRRGRIINVASGGGTFPIPYMSSYVSSKTALLRFSECLAAETKPFGLAVFSVGPGTVKTAMSEHALNTVQGAKWLPWFRRIIDEGLMVPPERPAKLCLELASGRADALSGCYLSIFDDLDVLAQHAGEIEEKKLYSLRVKTLNSPQGNPAAASILALAEKAQNP